MRLKIYILVFIFFIQNLNSTEKCYQKETIDKLTLLTKNIQKKEGYHLFTIPVEEIPTDIYIPVTTNGKCYKVLLVLPGWKFSRKRWFLETDLLKYVKKYNYIAIAPETSITIYESKYYPETKLKWHSKPGMEYFTNDFFPFFRKQEIFLNSKFNFALGLSTGARGVVMIASTIPDLFFAIAGLSGDYDQTITPKDNLMRLTYGDYEKFQERWQMENPLYMIKKMGWKAFLYLGHGKQDPIVPYIHSKHFYEFLVQEGFATKVTLSLKENFQHDFAYWNSELNSIFDFFETQIQNYKKN
ncbi:MAG: alpha/beta hydrolase family protein [Leptonema sp. (in: bacteria)]